MQYIIRYILAFILFLQVLMLFGQNRTKIDSLMNSLKTCKSDTERVFIYKELGWEYRNVNPEKAFEFGLQSLAFAQKLKMDKEIGGIYNYLGIIRRNQGSIQSALSHYNMALKISMENKNTGEIAYALNNIGDILNSQKNYAQALEYVSGALEKFIEINDLKGIAYSHTQLSLIYSNIFNYNKAIDHCLQAIKIREKISDFASVATSYNYLAEIYEKKGEDSTAYIIYLKGLKIREDINDIDAIAQSCITIGTFFYKNNNFVEAIKYFEKGLILGQGVKSPKRICSALEGLSNIYREKSDYKVAYNYYVQYKLANDSLYNEESIKKLTKLETEYRFMQQQRIIELEQQQKELKKDKSYQQMVWRRNLALILSFVALVVVGIILYLFRNQRHINKTLAEQKKQIEDQRDKLQQVNATKDKFFSILAHDLKNPFTSIIGYSEMLIKHYSRFDDVQKKEFLESINNTAYQTHKLLVNLLQWARTQTGNIPYQPEVTDLSTLAKENILLQKESAKKKKINILSKVDDTIKVFVDKNMINTTIRNLTGNAIKFTNQGGEITIDALENGKYVKVCVKDTGVGMNTEDIQKLFRLEEYHTTEGTFKETGTGLGLIICKEFIERHGGSIWVESELGNGTIFYFTLPKANAAPKPAELIKSEG
jgi:signal transduction histidine kinase